MAEDLTAAEVGALRTAIEELNKVREAKLALDKKLNKVAQNRLSDIQQEALSYQEHTKELRTLNVEMAAYVQKIKEAGDELAQDEARKKFLALKEKEIELLDETIKKQGHASKEQEKELHFLKQQRADLEENIPLMEEALKIREAEANLSAKLGEAKQAAQDLGDQFGATAGNILGIQKNWKEAGLTGRMLDAVDKGSSLADVTTAMKDGFVEMVNPTNMLASSIIKVVKGTQELTGDLGSAFGQFKETTGGGDEYLGVLSDVVSENYALGVSTEQSVAAVGTLYTELEMFNQMSMEAQTQLGATVAKLEAFDVSASAAAEAADILMQGIGYTADEFIQFEQRLKSMSSAIGVPMSKLHKQFAQASQVIAQYGEKGEEEFRKLAAAAKATGVEMSSLLQIAGQFDTFQEASDHVGSLNAALGGTYFNTVEMVKASEEERIDIMRQRIKLAGKDWSQMGKYERKMFAAALNIKDLNDANKLLGTSNQAYEELQRMASDASMSLADLSEEAFNTLGPMQKFEMILRKFQKPFDSVLKMLDLLATFLFYVADTIESGWVLAFGEAEEGFTLFILAMMTGFMKIGKIIPWILGLVGKLFSVITGGMPVMGKAIGKTMQTMSKGLGKSAAGISKFAGSVIKLGFGIGLAAAGIGVMAYAFSILFDSIKDVDGMKMLQVLGFLTGIIAIALTLGAMAVGGVGLLVIAAGFGAMATGILALSGALSALPTDELNALASVFEGIGGLTSKSASNLAAVGSALSGFKIGEIAGIQELTGFMTAVSKISPETAKATAGITENAALLASATTTANTTQLVEALTNLVKGSMDNMKGATGAGGTNRESVIKVEVDIDGRTAWKGIKRYAAKDMGAR